MSLRDFIEANRQTGSTTLMVEQALKSGGYIIVGSLQTKRDLLRKHPTFPINNVFTVAELGNPNTALGREKRPVFIDVPVVYNL